MPDCQINKQMKAGAFVTCKLKSLNSARSLEIGTVYYVLS